MLPLLGLLSLLKGGCNGRGKGTTEFVIVMDVSIFTYSTCFKQLLVLFHAQIILNLATGCDTFFFFKQVC